MRVERKLECVMWVGRGYQLTGIIDVDRYGCDEVTQEEQSTDYSGV